MAGYFQLRKHLLGADNPVITDVVIANSADMITGQAMRVTAGFAADATAGSPIFGIVVGFVTDNGLDLRNAVSGSDYDGTYTDGIIGAETYTASADNQTDKKVKVKVIADPYALFYNDTAGDLAAADDFLFFDLTSATQVADQNGSETAGALQLWQRDPDGDADASKGLFRIAEWEGNTYAQP